MNDDGVNGKLETKDDVFRKAYLDFCTALDRFGPKEILDLLVINSRQDEVVGYLLTQFPVTVAFGKFLSTLPVFKPTKRRRGRKRKKGMTS